MYINDKKQLGGCNQNDILCKYLIGYFKTKPYDIKCSIDNETCRGECCFYTIDKDKMLNKLMDDLKSKTDEELIKDYEDAGIKVIDYKPGTQGKVTFKDDYFNKVNKALDALSDEEFEQLMIKAGIENCPYEDDIERIEAYYRKILKSNGFSEEDIKEYLKTVNN